MNRRTNAAGVALIKEFEGCRLKAYRCSANKWTVGYGHTGPDVYQGLSITQERAENLLYLDLERFEKAVAAATQDVPTTDNQFAAMVSLFFNLGTGWIPKASVMRFHKQGRYRLAAAAFLLFSKAAGRKLPGLIRRRNAERKLYATP